MRMGVVAVSLLMVMSSSICICGGSLTLDSGADKDVVVVISRANHDPAPTLQQVDGGSEGRYLPEISGMAGTLEVTPITADGSIDTSSRCGHHKNPSDNETLISGCRYKFKPSDRHKMAQSYLFGWVAIKNIIKESFSCLFTGYECQNVIVEEKSHSLNTHWSNKLCDWRVRMGRGDDYFYVPAFPTMVLLFDIEKSCTARAKHEENYIGSCYPMWDRLVGSREIAKHQTILGSEEDHVPMGRLSWNNPLSNHSLATSCELSVKNTNPNGRVAILIPDIVKYVDIIDGGNETSFTTLKKLHQRSSVYISGSNSLKVMFTQDYSEKIFNSFNNFVRFSFLFLPDDFESTSYVFPTVTNCGKLLPMLDFEHSQVIGEQDFSANEVYDCVWNMPVNGTNLHIHFDKFDMGNSSEENLDSFSSSIYDEWGKESFIALTSYRSNNRGGLFIHKFKPSNTKSNTSFYLKLPPDAVALFLRMRIVKRIDSEFDLTMNLYHTGDTSVTGTETVFKCDNYLYIDSSSVCDGHNQCGDNSDEDVGLCDQPKSSFNNCTRSPTGCLMREPTKFAIDTTPCCMDNPFTEPCMFLHPNDSSRTGECCPKNGTGVVCDKVPSPPPFWSSNMLWFIIGGILLLLVVLIVFLTCAILRGRRRRPYSRMVETAPETGVGTLNPPPDTVATPSSPPVNATASVDSRESPSPSRSESSSSDDPELDPTTIEVEPPALRNMVESVMNKDA